MELKSIKDIPEGEVLYISPDIITSTVFGVHHIKVELGGTSTMVRRNGVDLTVKIPLEFFDPIPLFSTIVDKIELTYLEG